MKYRIAKKLRKAVGTPRESAYSEGKLAKAIDRCERTKSARETNDFWDDLLGNQLTVSDRAYILRGAPQMALGLLMRTDERDWNKTANQIAKEQSTVRPQPKGV